MQLSFTHSPLARAETIYRQRTARRMTLRGTLGVLFYGTMCLFGVGLLANEILAAVNGTSLIGATDDASLFFGIYALLVTVMHFRLIFKTLARAAGSVSRERRHDERWESIVMTGIDSRQIIWGKWWAIVQGFLPDYALLAFLRVCAGLSAASFVSRALMQVYGSYTSGTVGQVEYIVPTAAHFLLAAVVLALFTLINLLLTAAVGVYAGMAYKRGALAAALLARALVVVVFAVGGFLIGSQALSIISLLTGLGRYVGAADSSWQLYWGLVGSVSGALGTLFDNGVTMTYSIIQYSYFLPETRDFFTTPQWQPALTFLISLVFYGVLIMGMLVIGQGQAERFGALRSREKQKSKYD